MPRRETATLAGGCFWCIEACFSELKGVESAVPGYAGGKVDDPTYEQVCSGSTGHAEVVQVTFDPDEVSFADLLHVFFTVHDPTTLNRQGADVGTQYRSAVLYHSDTQKAETERVIQELEAAKVWSDPIVTEVAKFDRFYEAEPKHHDYFKRNQGQPYCQAVIAPKVAKVRKAFLEKLKA